MELYQELTAADELRQWRRPDNGKTDASFRQISCIAKSTVYFSPGYYPL